MRPSQRPSRGARPRPGEAAAPARGSGDGSVEGFFAGRPLARAVFERVRAVMDATGGCGIRVSKSQVAFRRRRGFAYLWLPDRYLARPKAEVVLTIALGRPDASPRWKEVVHPARNQWIHHLEVHGPAEVDDEVADWLIEAAERAG